MFPQGDTIMLPIRHLLRAACHSAVRGVAAIALVLIWFVQGAEARAGAGHSGASGAAASHPTSQKQTGTNPGPINRVGGTKASPSWWGGGWGRRGWGGWGRRGWGRRF